jgi:hypothetical protein
MIRKSMSVAKYTALGVVPARFNGRRFDQTAVDLLAQKVLGELARDAEMDSANSHSYKKAA